MTVKQAIAQVDALRPNQYPVETKVQWLSDLDGMFYREQIAAHEPPPGDTGEFTPYDPANQDALLLVKAPYEDLYLHYLAMQISLHNGEIQKYNNDMALFNATYSAVSKAYTRAVMPKQQVTHFTL